MKKTDELKKVMNAKLAEIEKFQQADEMDKARNAAKELDAIRNELEMAQSIEDAKKVLTAQDSLKPAHVISNESSAALSNRVFNKLVLGRQLNEEEREFVNAAGTPGQVEVTPGKGGYLVPVEQMPKLEELRRAYYNLKDYCNVQTAGSKTGQWPTLGAETEALLNFDELNAITEHDVTFGQLTYTVASYGDIIPVSNEILEDANVNLIDIIGKRFVRRAVNAENLDIVNKLPKTETSGYTGLTAKKLMKMFNVALDPAIGLGAKIFTNQDGMQWLAELDDGNNRPLLTPDVTEPEKCRFRGHEIVVIGNNVLASPTGKIPFYVGSLADYLAFFERKGVEVAVSTEAGFTKNATLIRAVERFGTTVDDAAALAYGTVTVSNG